jgi:hypothetical protein
LSNVGRADRPELPPAWRFGGIGAARGSFRRVYVNTASTTEGHDLYPDDPRVWASVFLSADAAQELMVALRRAAGEAYGYEEDGA